LLPQNGVCGFHIVIDLGVFATHLAIFFMGSGVGLFHQLVCLADGGLDVTLKTEPFAGVKGACRSKVFYFLRVIVANPNHPLQVLLTAAHAVFFIVVNADDGVAWHLVPLVSVRSFYGQWSHSSSVLIDWGGFHYHLVTLPNLTIQGYSCTVRVSLLRGES
jgi:hypothetical protein